MIHWFFIDIISFLVSIFIAGIIIPQILLIAFRKNLFDEIDERKIHKGVVPRLGGIAFFPSILFSFCVVIGFNLKYYGWDSTGLSLEDGIPFFFMVCAVLLMYLIGMADDLMGVRYVAKFAIQVLASVFIILSGIYIHNFFGFLWIHSIADWIGWLVTAFIVVYVVNSINLIDGIDGLASGLSTVAFIFYAVMFFSAGEYAYSLLASASAGTLLPFFYYNVFGNAKKRKKIFMGDTGALTTGMILVFCSLAILRIDDKTLITPYNPVILGISPLLIPLFDVVRVYLHRVARHKNPFLPDKSHIHHKLLALGLNQSVALILILFWSVSFIVLNMFLSEVMDPTLIILSDIIIWTIGNLLLTKAISIKEAKLGKILFD